LGAGKLPGWFGPLVREKTRALVNGVGYLED